MKLLCINNKKLSFNGFSYQGDGLKEGKIYTTIGKSYKGDGGALVYYIEGLGSKLCCRFTELLDERSVSERAIEKLKEDFQLN